MDDKNPLPDLLLARVDRPVCDSLSAWLPLWRDVRAAHSRHGGFVASMAAALHADRMAWAFFTGYQGALHAAFGDADAVGSFGVASLCANETARKLTEVETRLVEVDGQLRLEGRKSWVLAGMDELDLYVLARDAAGPARGPGSLRIVRVPRHSDGVEMGPVRAQPVVPEVAHAEVVFRNVPIERTQLLAGDGYSAHARPFRLREDVFVTGCTLAYLLAQAHAAGWPTPWRQRCMAVIVALGECAELPATDTSTELLTAGVLALAGDVIAATESLWLQGEQAVAERWIRDKPILGGGKDARRQRVQAAWVRAGWATPS